MLKSKLFTRQSTIIGGLLAVLCVSLLTHCAYANKSPKSHPSIEATQLQFEKSTLNNGLEVVVIPIHRAPVVFHSLWYKIGSADSPQHCTGIAHFLEHLMFKGTAQYPKDSFDQLIFQFGGSQNASTHWDYTMYHVTVAAEHLEKIMALEADRMRHLSFNQEDVEIEKGVVLQERMMRVDVEPSAWLNEAVNAQLFKTHPYKAPVIGYESHIQAYSYDDARRFYEQWYHPNNAVLVIAGDVEPEEVFRLAAQHYGAIPEANLPNKTRIQEPKHFPIRNKVELYHPDSGNYFQRYYPVGNLKSLGAKQTATLVLLAQVLGDDNHGFFIDILVGDYKPFSAINTAYTYQMRDDYVFSLSASYKNDYELAKIEGLLDAELARFIRDGMSEQRLALMKRNLKLGLSYQQDSLSGLAEQIGTLLANGYRIEDFQALLLAIDEVSVKDLQSEAKLLFANEPHTVAYAYAKQEK